MSLMLPFIVAFVFASEISWTTTSCFAFRPPPLHTREVLPQPRVREVLDHAALFFEVYVFSLEVTLWSHRRSDASGSLRRYQWHFRQPLLGQRYLLQCGRPSVSFVLISFP